MFALSRRKFSSPRVNPAAPVTAPRMPPISATHSCALCGQNRLRPCDWRVFPPKLVHTDQLSDRESKTNVEYDQQPWPWLW